MRSISRILSLAAAICCLALALKAAPALALSVSPLVVDLSAAGRDARGAVTVLNDSNAQVPVELKVFRLELGLDGEAKRTPADEDFVIFPPQAILKPGARQVFRLQWAGDPDIAKSQSYMLTVNQVPVKLPNSESGVQVVFNFGVIVNVAPLAGTAELAAVRTDLMPDDKGVGRPAVTVENRGQKHAYIADASLTLAGEGWKRSIAPAEMKELVGLGLVMPGSTRRFLLPIDLPEGAGGALKASISMPSRSR